MENFYASLIRYASTRSSGYRKVIGVIFFVSLIGAVVLSVAGIVILASVAQAIFVITLAEIAIRRSISGSVIS